MSEEHTKKGPETEEEATVTEEAAIVDGGAEVREDAVAERQGSAEEIADTEQSSEDGSVEPATEEAATEHAVEEPEESAEEELEAGESVEPTVEESTEEDEAEAEKSASEEPEKSAVDEPPAGEPVAKPAVEADDERSARMRWYVVHTYSGRENKVKDTIERMIRNSEMKDQFGKVLVATEEVAEMKKGKKKVSQRKLFPSYILIEMEMTDEAWGMIENVPGVTHFVGEGKKPFPIPKKEVDRILGRMVKKEGVVPEVPYTIGEHVKVVDGPFTDFSGIVDEINPERGKLKVLVSIFGRETPVELDFLQVKSL